MKKYIVTSLCTLGISLLGAYGAKEDVLNINKDITTNSNTTSVEQTVNEEDITNVPADSETTVTDDITSNSDADVSVDTPQTNMEDTNSIASNEYTDKAVNNNAPVNKEETVSSNRNTAGSQTKAAKPAETAKTTETANATVNNTVKNTENNNVQKPAASQNTVVRNNNNSNNNNGQVMVYKNIDLSQCNSVNDVVSVLQKNGYSNINSNNIQNITSLDDVLSYVQGNKSTNKNNATQTTKPVQTTKPAPTTKPAQTTKPAPSTKPQAKPSNNTNTGISGYAAEVLRLVNQERAKAGLSALTTNSTLQAAADKRAQETVQSFSHTRPNGTKFSTALQEFGVPFRTAGENIAYGQKSPQEVVTGWMNSPGHRANILNGNFGKIGIGVYQSNGTIYWSQLFTN